jgi:hypothetical protein
MKTAQTTTLIEVTHWTCTVEGHFHKTRDVAERCIQKHSAPKAVKRRWTEDMIADVCAEIVSGTTYKSVADKYGVQQERIRQVYSKGIRMMLHPARLDEPFPDHDRWSVESVRSNADFWNRRIAKLRSAP